MIDAIDRALDRLPPDLLARSGSVFYTGKEAFRGERPVYFLGLNPGGDPVAQQANSVARHIDAFRIRTEPWSAYADERWEGAAPGCWGMQPRVLHMLRALEMGPQLVPASNVVFVRSRGEADLRHGKRDLLNACWPVHQAVIDSLGTRVVACFGRTAGEWVRERLGAHALIDRFREDNRRGWRSETHCAADGRSVVTLTHPGRADWRNPKADPTDLVRRAIGG